MTTKTISAAGTAKYASGYNNHGAPATGVTFVNRGTIGNSATQWGAIIYGSGNTFANYGVITDPGANTPPAAGAGFAGANDVLYNHASGTLGSAYGEGVYTGNDSVVQSPNFTLINAGLISGATTRYSVDVGNSGIVTNLSTGTISHGIAFFNGYLSSGDTATSNVSVVNSGLIQGVHSPKYNYAAIYARNGGAVTNLAGTIAGSAAVYGIRFANANALNVPGTVTNAATISGGSGAAIVFAAIAGNRVIDQSGGVFIGTVNGGSNATMELASTASAGVLTATSNQFTNFSNLIIDSGARWTINGDSGLSTEFAKIGGFTVGNTISLTGLSQTPTTFTSSVGTVSGTVQTSVIIKASATPLETLTLLGSIASSNFSFNAGTTSTLTIVVPPPTVTESLVSDTGTSGSDKITSNDALTGGGDPNATVTLTEGITNLGTATANAGGTWTFTPSPALAQGSNTVVASETNGGGTGSATLTFTYDTVDPTVSSDSLVGGSPNNASSDQFTVTFSESVTGVDNSDFTATRSGSVADTGITVTPVSGSVYTVTVNGVTGDGTLRLDLNGSGTGIQDIAGNPISGGYTSGQTYTIDHTAPAVTESLVSDTGTPGDKITSNDAITGGGDPNAVVTIKEGVTTLGTTTANGSGTWSFSGYSPSLSDGSHTIVASETDAAGNTGSASLTFTLDTTAPAVTESLVSDTGTPGDKITSNDAITGGGDPNAVVTIKEGVTTLGTTTANGSGTWSFSGYSPSLSDGSHTIVASETDAAGNTGSASLTFTLDTTAPAVTESLVSDTGTPGDKITSNDAITGGGDPNAVVTIKEGVTTLGTTTANGSGTWSFSGYSPSLSDGSHTIVASETDAAGNTGSASLTFTLDTTAPSVSSIDTVGSPSNTGGTEQFAVDFSEAVTGVSTSSFALTDTGSVTGTINSISGSGEDYTVTVTGATGSGTMKLDLKSSGTGITDTAGNGPTAGFTSGETYSIAPSSATPSISAPGTATVGVGQAGSLGTITIAESPTTGGETFTMTVFDNTGTLSANTGAIGGGGLITPSGGGTTLTFFGTLLQVNADLTTLTDTEPATAGDTISYGLKDSNGGTASPASTTVTVNGLPAISAPGSASVTQNSATAVTPIIIGETGDTTTSGETFSAVVSDGAGVLSANTGAIHGGGLITPSGGGTTLTFAGTLLQVNADLTTLEDDDASTASDTISVHATDSFGNSDATDASIPVTVLSYPELTQPTISLTVPEGQSLGNLWSELIANGVDPEPASLTIVSVGTTDTQGYVGYSYLADTLTYLATGLNPSEPVDAFTYTLEDGSGGTVTGTVDVTITGPNLPTTIITTRGSTATATGSGQRLIAEGTGETLIGSTAGGDEFFGGPDTTISAFGAGNTIYADPGNHSIAMGTNNNTLTLGDGNNTISASGTGNTVTAGNGNNHVSGMTGNATITLGNGNDSVSVTGANNAITVGTGTDTISAGNGGNEVVTAGNGANTISGGGANDQFTGGTGTNKITATGADATIVTGSGNSSDGAATILGSAAGDQITTGGGNDSIQVTAGSAIIKAGIGSNTIKFAGSSNDVINQGGNDTLTDTGTNNTIVLPLAGQGLDTINGSVLANGDTFDLRKAMAGTTWDQQLSDLGNYLSTGTSGPNTLVQLSVTSGGTPLTIAVLNGQGAVTLSSFAAHSLLT